MAKGYQTMVDKPPEKPARRRFRVSIRMLMLAVVLLAVWLGWTVSRERRQAAAIRNIVRLGGVVGYSYNYIEERGNYPPFPSGDPPAPKWLLPWVGPEYFRTANFVGFAWTRQPTSLMVDLAPLEDLPDVHVLDLASTTFGDSDMAHVHRLKLIRFVANDTLLGDEGLAYLGGMARLWEIGLAHTRITDKGLTYLATMPKLKTVDLRGLRVTDAGLANLSKLTNLEYLTLSDTLIGDRGLVHLSGLSQLKSLDLSGTQVTDAGLEHIGALPRLKFLALPKTGVTDAGINRLRDAIGDVIRIDQR
jgi:hypothetical protein